VEPQPRSTIARQDLDALRWVGQQYACPADQLEIVMGRLQGVARVPRTVVLAAATRWATDGLASLVTFVHGEAPWIWATAAGLEVAGLPYPAAAPKARLLAHVRAVNRVRLFVEPRREGAVWRPERELRAFGRPASRPIPDAEILDVGGNVIAVEVELTPKSAVPRRKKMLALVARYDSTWYFASAEAWLGVHDAACQVPPHLADLVRIYALEDIP